MKVNTTKCQFNTYLDKSSIPINGLSPVPRDQCGAGSTMTAADMHPMYSSFRAAPPPNPTQIPPPLPPPQSHSGKNFFFLQERGTYFVIVLDVRIEAEGHLNIFNFAISKLDTKKFLTASKLAGSGPINGIVLVNVKAKILKLSMQPLTTRALVVDYIRLASAASEAVN